MIAKIKEKIKSKNWRFGPVGILAVAALVLFLTIVLFESRGVKTEVPTKTVATTPQTGDPYVTPDTPRGRLTVFAKMHRLPLSDWPSALIEFMEKYPETEGFVMNYPFYKNTVQPVDLTSCLGADEMPLLLQWDSRWGYTEYSGELFGTSGCGPTALSMVCLHLLQDAKFTPRYVADFSEENDYYTTGKGSNWTLIYEGGEMLGLEVEEIPTEEDVVAEQLEAGNPVICIVGPGDFTYSGHFIVLAGLENGMIRINDPNSKIRSEKLWEFSAIKDQILKSWACSVP